MFLAEPFAIFIITIAAVSFGFGVSLHCTSHPSGLRSLVKRLSIDPFRHLADQKIFGSMPCPNDFTSLMVASQPCDSSWHGQ